MGEGANFDQDACLHITIYPYSMDCHLNGLDTVIILKVYRWTKPAKAFECVSILAYDVLKLQLAWQGKSAV